MKKRNIVATASLVGLIGASAFALAESNSVFRYPVYGAKASSSVDTETGGQTTPSSNITSPTNVVFTETGDQLSANVGDSATITIKDSLGNQLGQTTSGSEGNFTSPLNPSVTSGDVLELTITNGEDTIVANITVPEGIGNTLDPEMVAMCKLETNEVKEEVVFPANKPILIYGNYNVIPSELEKYDIPNLPYSDARSLMTGVIESGRLSGIEEWTQEVPSVYIAGEMIHRFPRYGGVYTIVNENIQWGKYDTVEKRLNYFRSRINGYTITEADALIYDNYRATADSVNTVYSQWDTGDTVINNVETNYLPMIFNEEYHTGINLITKDKSENYNWCIENGYETAY